MAFQISIDCKPNTYWDVYRIGFMGIADSIVALLCAFDEFCKEEEEAQKEVNKLESALLRHDFYTVKVQKLNLQRRLTRMIMSGKFPEPISNWMAAINGRLDWDENVVLKYLAEYCSDYNLSTVKKMNSIDHKLDSLQDIQLKFRQEHPDLYVEKILNMQKFSQYFMENVIKPFPIDLIYAQCVLFMNSPLLLPATYFQTNSLAILEIFQYDKKDIQEVFDLREQALVYLATRVEDEYQYKVFRMLVTRAMRLSSWIGRPRWERYFVNLRSDEVRECFNCHELYSRCYACDVKMMHCYSMTSCMCVTPCKRHMLLTKDYKFSTQDYIEIFCLKARESIEDIYTFFAGGIHKPISQVEFISKVDIAIAQIRIAEPPTVVPPPQQGYYKPRPFAGLQFDFDAFTEVKQQIIAEENPHPDLTDIDRDALILSGHFSHAIAWTMFGREDIDVLTFVASLPMDTAVSACYNEKLNGAIEYVFRQYRSGLPASYKYMKEFSIDSRKAVNEFLLKDKNELYPANQPEIPETQSDEEDDFGLADLMERL